MAEKTVARAVERMFRIAVGDEARSLDGMAKALSRERGRPLIVLHDAKLPPGVFGQWVRRPDHDEVSCAAWVHARDRTIAHELGHIALGHFGRPAIDLATDFLPASAHDLATLMLRRDCTDTYSVEEADAEAFGSLLLRRLQDTRGSGNPAIRSRLDEALG
ncbi:hypothetical protein CJ178_30565 [Rhodococcus sp. ACPA4]|uniref:hypothetical protein n=1 Tax=Rhodococcus sp. ACPA4 TaxID=2028571 RepID=UPI000BB0E99D|nr:hypothetical protein [Rhodococcus sp. ACPA4]PBC35804.1 hypothetical protein CJ178_30565 [Rhodococcus sp. ACPA4]